MYSLLMSVMTIYIIMVLIVIPGLIEYFLIPVGYLWIPYLIGVGAILFTNTIIWYQFGRAYRKHLKEKREKEKAQKAIEEGGEEKQPEDQDQKQLDESNPEELDPEEEQRRREEELHKQQRGTPQDGTQDGNEEGTQPEEEDQTTLMIEDGSDKPQLPTLSSVIVAYLPNEKEIIEKSLEHHLAIPYNGFHQVILVYNTNNEQDLSEVEERLQQMKGYYGPYKKLDVFNVVGSTSKAENVNFAIQNCEGPIVGIYDSDCLPLPEGLERAVMHLVKDEADVVQGRCVIRNGECNMLTRMIAVEFEMIYGVNHPGGSELYGFGIFGGSNAYWKREVLALIQMDKKMLTEDIDSSFRAMRLGKKVIFDRQAVATELAPETLTILRGQRLRWAQGWFQASLRHYLPSILSNKFGKKQKVGTSLLFLWRELYVYLPFQPIVCWVIFLIKVGTFEADWIFWVFLSITILTLISAPCQMIATYIMSHDIVKPHKLWFLQAFVLFWPYQLLLSLIALGSHALEFFKVRNWIVTSRAPTAPVLEIPYEDVLAKEITVLVEQEPISTPRQLVPDEEEDDDFSSDGEDEFEQMKLREGEDEEDVVVVVDQQHPKKLVDVFEDEIELDSDDEDAPVKPSSSSSSSAARDEGDDGDDDDGPKADFLKAMLKKPIDKPGQE